MSEPTIDLFRADLSWRKLRGIGLPDADLRRRIQNHIATL